MPEPTARTTQADEIMDAAQAHFANHDLEEPTTGSASAAPQPSQEPRKSGAFLTRKAKRRYFWTLGALVVLGAFFAVANLTWAIPVPAGTAGFWRIIDMRTTALVVILLVVTCQAVATVSFQTVTNNRIITPSIMGFESLYVAVQTSAIYFLGVAGVSAVQGLPQFIMMIVLMVGFSLALYGWLLSGRYGNLQVMLLVGIIIGGGLGSVSTFMQRLLTPSEFDVLVARLFGSVAKARPEYFPVAIPLCIIVTAALIWKSRRLNVIALGRDLSTNLGINHRRETMQVLFLVSILMAVTTSMIGPMTFLGFLIATLAYQIAGTHDHRYVFPIAIATGFAILSGAYFILKNVFYAEGAVSIIIEAVGGTAFLILILRKGRL